MGEQAWGDNGVDVTISASYGLGAWGHFAWGEGNLTNALSTQTGSVVASIDVGVDVTGIALTSFINDVAITGTTNISIIGIELTTAIGEEIPQGNAIVSVTGIALISTVDPVSITADGNV